MLNLPDRWRSERSNANQSDADIHDDAQFVIQDIGNWIKNADAKSTVVAAATGVVASASVSKADVVYAALKNDEFHCKWLLIVLVVSVVAAVLVSACYLYRALSPRTSHSGSANRFAWPALVAATLVTPIDNSWATVHNEARQQIAALAGIAHSKFTSFRAALRWFGVAFFASLCMIVLATWNSQT